MREGWTIPKGSSAVFLIYKLPRSAKYWPRPLVFDPDRFLSGKNCFTYFFLFSYGRRNCIRQHFAMLNMTVIIVTLIRIFLIKIDNPIGIAVIGLKMSLSLKPYEISDWTKYGLPNKRKTLSLRCVYISLD
ncbi:cytochrome P450 4A14-like [Vespa crabro]|uniref:cytochrome P450 4A14-like n=1 Tax=Vespa crabro TaxID=7445 RepID=UPI001F02295B|nr:cytochrome P450 4A14-like [Vespa crabro]